MDDKKCPVCEEESTLRCSNCKVMYYCGKEHQLKHWHSTHKSECEDMKKLGSMLNAVENNPKMGFKLVQTMMAANMGVDIDVEGETEDQRASRLAAQLSIECFGRLVKQTSASKHWGVVKDEAFARELATVVFGSILNTLGFMCRPALVVDGALTYLCIVCMNTLVMNPYACLIDGNWTPPKGKDGHTDVDTDLKGYMPITKVFDTFKVGCELLHASTEAEDESAHLAPPSIDSIAEGMADVSPAFATLLQEEAVRLQGQLFCKGMVTKAIGHMMETSAESTSPHVSSAK